MIRFMNSIELLLLSKVSAISSLSSQTSTTSHTGVAPNTVRLNITSLDKEDLTYLNKLLPNNPQAEGAAG
jgi:hypothetical protein